MKYQLQINRGADAGSFDTFDEALKAQSAFNADSDSDVYAWIEEVSDEFADDCEQNSFQRA